MKTRILCLGNELVRDDGVGIRVGRILASLPLPQEVRIEFTPHLGFDLLEAVQESERLILVDAMHTGRQPGTCITLKGAAIERYAAGAAVSHTVGIAELIKLAQHLAPDWRRASIFFVGIEGQAFDEYGIDLTPAVRQAIPEAVTQVLRAIGASEALLAQAAHASAQYLDPALATILLGEPGRGQR
jgi:hydrogenase maturation protease